MPQLVSQSVQGGFHWRKVAESFGQFDVQLGVEIQPLSVCRAKRA
ncbi:hypothetical protein ACEV9E_16835 [Vibrio parahaemolyticus]|nr:hypothetical protein [Vibrio parahaemolyticus]MDG2899627.1 hypothetical protein [Vibrio parahaemolyticus]